MKFYDRWAFTYACVRTVYTVNMIRALVHALLHALMDALVLTTPVKTSLYFYFLRPVDVYGPKAERKKSVVRTSFVILTSACLIISQIAYVLKLFFRINFIMGLCPSLFRVNSPLSPRI